MHVTVMCIHLTGRAGGCMSVRPRWLHMLHTGVLDGTATHGYRWVVDMGSQAFGCVTLGARVAGPTRLSYHALTTQARWSDLLMSFTAETALPVTVVSRDSTLATTPMLYIGIAASAFARAFS